jgi:hypothetical protein
LFSPSPVKNMLINLVQLYFYLGAKSLVHVCYYRSVLSILLHSKVKTDPGLTQSHTVFCSSSLGWIWLFSEEWHIAIGPYSPRSWFVEDCWLSSSARGYLLLNGNYMVLLVDLPANLSRWSNVGADPNINNWMKYETCLLQLSKNGMKNIRSLEQDRTLTKNLLSLSRIN